MAAEVNNNISESAKEDLKNFCIRMRNQDYRTLKMELFYYAAGRMPNATIADVANLIDKIVEDLSPKNENLLCN